MSEAAVVENESKRGLVALTVAIVVLLGVIPPALYWLALGRLPTVTAPEAKRMLEEQTEPTALVDVRSKAAYEAGHLRGAESWPWGEIRKIERADQAPPALRDRRLLLICDVGWASGVAVAHLNHTGAASAANVRGGVQEWIRSVESVAGGPRDQWQVGGEVTTLPFRHAPPHEQMAAVLAFFIFKPIYTILAALVAALLWNKRALDLVALRWAMIFFFLGENACAANYLVFGETSYLLEYLHSLGMLLCFGAASLAVLEGFDARVLGLSDPQRRCAALPLCTECVKYTDTPCRLRRMFYVVIPACAVLAMMLPMADWQDTSYNTLIAGRVYNYAHLRIYQVLENWYCPAAAVTLFAASLSMLALKRTGAIAAAKIAFAAGLGPLGFGALRMLLGCAYDQNRVWYLFWEETTELLFIFACCLTLWIFRHRLAPELTAVDRLLDEIKPPVGQET